MHTRARLYIYDIDTREELAQYECLGNDEAGILDGVRYHDTTLGYLVRSLTTGKRSTITAEDFPGRRVAGKDWTPVGSEWKMLVSRTQFAGNEACTGNEKHSELGKRARQVIRPAGAKAARHEQPVRRTTARATLATGTKEIETMKQLIIGHDYASLFGLPKGCSMVYQGDDTWTASMPGKPSMTAKSAAQTKKVLEALNKPSTMTGRPA